MADSEHDDEFEAYLERRAPLDQRRLEPPPELDRLVLGKARKAIQPARPVQPLRTPRWAVPMGFAGVLLLSCAILFDIGVRTNQQRQSTRRHAAPAQAAAPVALPIANITTQPWPLDRGATVVQATIEPESSAADAEELALRAQTRSRVARVEFAKQRIEIMAAAPEAAAAPLERGSRPPAASAAPDAADDRP